MTQVPQTLSVSTLHDHLEAMAREMAAQLLLAVDESGNVIEAVGAQVDRTAPTLAALGAANLAATHEISRLAGLEAMTQSPQTLLIEGKHGAVILVEGAHSLNFIAVLSPNSIIGLARLEMRGLALIKWLPADSDQVEQPIDLSAELLSQLDIEF
jgi:predicted regulator of Ras-like GTPase activity (Roadblock/LC7/MglB family)